MKSINSLTTYEVKEMPWFGKLRKLDEKVEDNELEPIIKKQETAVDEEESEEEEEEEEQVICVNCKFHSTFFEGYEHTCIAGATKTVSPITGQEDWEDVEDCEDKNSDGDCEDFEKKEE
jgi:hypothetical protein